MEKIIDGLPGEFVDDFLRPAAIGDPGVISQVEVIVSRQETGHAFQDRQSPESGVEKSDHEKTPLPVGRAVFPIPHLSESRRDDFPDSLDSP